ncbi:hypothetical protein N7676_15775 [Stenotrophomonas sp. GD03993]|uniref:hypothetical protein n=1 Tax=unclassified Stenotrophomonas TaxID=196198 RepID=UPI00244693B5|nr:MULTISPECIES: hypothetical protein [unclassified Stenotrophomonas]MDH0190261.1 hypothetical protein [Stenotrophomonas sp. GD04051]MDH0465265.1 hypothetical protein [Stenotrophomonas sp. GD03993]MDH0877890.1 hypothetical protein [Stenotrophomonas sp. GD03877]
MADKYQVRVTHVRAKYPPAIYTDIEAKSQLCAGMAAVERYIAENNHPPRRVKERGSAYYGRFAVELLNPDVVSLSEMPGR